MYITYCVVVVKKSDFWFIYKVGEVIEYSRVSRDIEPGVRLLGYWIGGEFKSHDAYVNKRLAAAEEHEETVRSVLAPT